MDLKNSSEKQNNSFNKKRRFVNPLSFIFSFFKKKKGKKNKKNSEILPGQDYDGLDKKLLYSLSPKKIPSLKQVKYAKKVLGPKERTILNLLIVVILVAALIWFIGFYRDNVVVYPRAGGEYKEGLIGSPKNINPLYDAARDVDSDVGRLIFSSLFKRDASGGIVNDLVEEYSISEDGLEYVFKLREDVKWHNGEDLSSADVVFTFEAIKNPEYGSPLRTSFIGSSVEVVDEYSFKIILSESYSTFLDLLTFGILPVNLWINISPSNAFLHELNLKPIGSGPYKFNSLTKNRSGEVREMSLVPNSNYYKQVPYISRVTLKFYSNYGEMIAALNNNQIDGISYLPHTMRSDLVSQSSLNFNRLNLPQISSLFFSSKNNSLLDSKDFRINLTKLIDKNKITNEVFSGNASVANGPILPSSPSYNDEIEPVSYNFDAATEFLAEADWSLLDIEQGDIDLIREVISLEKEKAGLSSEDNQDRIDQIDKNLGEKAVSAGDISNFEVKKDILKRFALEDLDLLGNWRYKKTSSTSKPYDYLKIELTTVDLLDNILVAEFLKDSWERAGIRTFIKTISPSQIQSEIIRQKNFEALLLSQVVGGDQDNYAFWHSSQISESGLNISEYRNREVDKLLEEARLLLNQDERIEKYKKFQELLHSDYPTAFLYFPSYTYVQNRKVKGFDSQSILNPADRFNNISNWYIKTNKKLEFRN